MIEQRLSNTNESATVSKSKKFFDLNKTLVCSTNKIWLKILSADWLREKNNRQLG